VEARQSSLEQAIKQYTLAMKDICGNNGSGQVYGFVTNREKSVNAEASSQQSEEVLILFSRILKYAMLVRRCILISSDKVT